MTGLELQSRMETRGRDHINALNDSIGKVRREQFIATLKEIIATLPDATSEVLFDL